MEHTREDMFPIQRLKINVLQSEIWVVGELGKSEEEDFRIGVQI
jgi:hypothetical protein